MIKLKRGFVYTCLDAPSKAQDILLYDALSYEIPNWKIIAKKKYNATKNRYWLKWKGINSFYDKKNHCFLTGLLPTVTQYLDTQRIPWDIESLQTVEKPVCSIDSSILEGIEFFDFQKSAVERFLKTTRGIIQIATGGGKTEIAIALTKTLNLPTIFLTHRIELLHQTKQRFIKRFPAIENSVGVIGDGIYEPNYITIATVQTLHSLLKRHPEQLADELRDFRFVVVDEAHRVGSEQFNSILSLTVNAGYRLGLTATPFMKDNVIYDMYLQGFTGPVVYRISATELIEKGILAQPFFRFYPITSPDLKGEKDWRDIYLKGIIDNEKRNEIIIDQAIRLSDMNHKTLIITQELQHANNLWNIAKARGLNTIIVSGVNLYDERTKALKQLSEKKLDALIVTNIFDEGLDVKDISAVIMASGKKSAPAFFQRTGRAIRKKDVNNYAVIIDFIDHQHPTLYEHSLQRMALVDNEPAFKII